MGWLGSGIDPRSTGDSRSLAPQGLQGVLDVAFSKPDPSRKKVCEQGIARDHFPHGRQGAPRIHGELKMLGFDLSEPRYNAGCGKRVELAKVSDSEIREL